MGLSSEKVFLGAAILFLSSSGVWGFSEVDANKAISEADQQLSDSLQKCSDNSNSTSLSPVEVKLCDKVRISNPSEVLDLSDMAEELVKPEIISRLYRDENIHDYSMPAMVIFVALAGGMVPGICRNIKGRLIAGENI